MYTLTPKVNKPTAKFDANFSYLMGVQTGKNFQMVPSNMLHMCLTLRLVFLFLFFFLMDLSRTV